VLGVQLPAAQAGVHGGLDTLQRMLVQQLQDPNEMPRAGAGAVTLLQGLPQARKRRGQPPVAQDRGVV
jgi:hypothetical protein